MALLQAAVDLGIAPPHISMNDSLKNIDFGKIPELVKFGAIGNIMEVDSVNGDTVKFFVEET